MYESDIGTWVLYQDHNDDYLRRWTATNAEFKQFYDRLYKDAVLINKLKFATATLSLLLLLALVF